MKGWRVSSSRQAEPAEDVGSWARSPRRPPPPTPPSAPTGSGRRGAASQTARRGSLADSGPSAPAGHAAADAEALPRNTPGLVGLTCGLLGLLFMALVPPLGLVLGVLAAVFGFRGRGRALRGEASGAGPSSFAVAIGIVALIVSVAMLAWTGAFVVGHSSSLQDLTRCLSQAHTSHARQACQQHFAKAVHGSRG